MKYKFWILVLIAGGILMIVGGATGGEFYGKLLTELNDAGFIPPEFEPLLASIILVIGFIANYGGYSVLVAVFLILIKWNRLGRIIITIATSFGMLGLLIYGVSWAVGYFGFPLSPTWSNILTEVHGIFTFQSGLALAGTAVSVVGKFGLKRAEKAYEEKAEEAIEEDEARDDAGTKFCPECGAKLPAHANFCNKCGKNFD